MERKPLFLSLSLNSVHSRVACGAGPSPKSNCSQAPKAVSRWLNCQPGWDYPKHSSPSLTAFPFCFLPISPLRRDNPCLTRSSSGVRSWQGALSAEGFTPVAAPGSSSCAFPFSPGYGQDLSGFGQGFSDPSQQPPPYGGPSVQPSSGPPAGGSGFGRGQNHNVQGFHPYRR